MKQLFNLVRQHRFYTAICVIGTAVTLAFVMVVVMVYDFRTATAQPHDVPRWYAHHAQRRHQPHGLSGAGADRLPCTL